MKFKVSSAEVHEALQPVLESVYEQIAEVLAEAPTRLLADIMEHGAVLTGGCARLQGLDQYLSERLRLPIRVAPEPEKATENGLKRLLRERSLRRYFLRRPASKPPRRSPRLMGLLVVLVGLLLTVATATQVRAGVATPLDQGLNTMLAPALKAANQAGHWPGARPAAVALDSTSDARAVEAQRRVQVLSEENRRLRGLWHSPPKLPAGSDAELMPARVVARSPQGWMDWLTLDGGQRQGLKTGLPVISSQGLVGQLGFVSAETSRVRRFTDKDALVGVAVRRRKTMGVLLGQGDGNCLVRYLHAEAGVKPGDAVTTSGLDGTYPKGLAVGRISHVYRAPGEIFLTATVEPTVRPDELSDVLVMK